MQHQTFSPHSGPENAHQIEAQLDADRTALAASLGALRDRLSFDAVWSDALSLVKTNAGPYATVLDRAIRANPMAVAVTAVGLAWLVLGRRNAPQAQDPSSLAGTRFEALSRWEDEGGPVTGSLVLSDDWIAEADRLRDQADVLLARVNMAVRDRLAPAAELAQSRADVLAALTHDVRHVMGQGLESLTTGAREAAITAREHTYDLHLRARHAGAEKVRDNPALAGAALAAAGALLAAFLPQSAGESRLLGAPRDRVMAEAKRVLDDERQRIAKSFNRIADSLSADANPTTNPDSWR